MYVEFEDVEFKHETELAWLVVIDGKEVWLPKSQCRLNEDEGVLEVAEWLAIEKGLI